MRRYLILTALFLLLSAYNYAQQADQRLIDFYGEEAITELQKNNPDSVAYLNYVVQEGFTIQYEVPENKLEGLKLLSDMELSVKNKKYKTVEDLAHFNRLEVLDVNPNPHAATLYRVDGTNVVLILSSYNQMKAIFEANH